MKNQLDRVSTLTKEEQPEGWAVVTIPEIIGKDGIFSDGDWVETKDQDPNGGVRLIQLADIGDGYYRDKSNRFLTKEKAIELNCTFLEVGDLLIARMPDPLGRSCIFPGDEKKSVTVVDVCVVRVGASRFEHKWLMYMINSPRIRESIESLQSGTTRKRISRKNLAKIELPIPPLPEQERIVAKIEELFTQLDAGVAELQIAKAQLKRYRQTVLKAAVKGELTREWREAHMDKLEPASVLLERILAERRAKWEEEELEKMRAKGKEPKDDKWKQNYIKPEKPDIDGFPQLPRYWVWANVSQISDVVTGSTPSKNILEYYCDEYPFYKPTDLNAGYYTKSSQDGLSAEGINKARLLPINSILVTCIGATIGKTGFIRKAGASNQQINAILPTGPILPEYIYFIAISPFFQKQIIDNASSTTLPIINKSRFMELALPLPSVYEQSVIISKLELHTTIIDETERQIDNFIFRSNQLRQSILKIAFEGKLVPQDPNDEPASSLLKRIEGERKQNQLEGKTRKKVKKRAKKAEMNQLESFKEDNL